MVGIERVPPLPDLSSEMTALAKRYNPVEQGAHCGICPLRGRTIVPPKPATSALKLIAVGEAPGAIEEREGAPFLGPSGQCLEGVLRKNAGPKRDEIHLTNAALCRGEFDWQNKRAAECCAPRLLGELAALPSDVTILTLGSSAAKSVLNAPGILKSRGFVWTAPVVEKGRVEAASRAIARKPAESAELALKHAILQGRALLAGRRVHPTLHPAFVLRSDLWRPIFDIDVHRALQRFDALDSDIRGSYESGGPELLARLGKGDVTCDIETDRLDPLTAQITCVGISDGRFHAVLYPWQDAWAPELEGFLKDCAAVVGHNSFNYDQLCLKKHGVDWSGVNWQDTLINHHAVYSHWPQSLAHCVTEVCDSEPWKILAKSADDERGFSKMTKAQLVLYNAQDVALTHKAWTRRDVSEQRVYEADIKLAAVARNMIWRGVPIDYTRLTQLQQELDDIAAALRGEMRLLTGNPEFQPSVYTHVADALYTRFALPVARKTEKGAASTDKVVIESLRTGDGEVAQFAKSLARWRLVKKIKSTYLDKLPLNAETGFAHFNSKSFGTRSGRFSSRGQSTPKYRPFDRRTKAPTPEGRVREVWCADPGYTFVYFDVSQAEMRIAAYLSGDPAFMKACEGDIHSNNSKVLFPTQAAQGWLDSDPNCAACVRKVSKICTCPKKDVKRGAPLRDIMKNIGFALTYVADDETAYLKLKSEGFPVEFGQVVRMLSNLRSVYRHYFRFVDKNLEMVRKCGYMRTPVLGRIQWFGWCPKITEIANYPVQGGLADVMNERMIEIDEKHGDWLPVIYQMHDACLFRVRNNLVEKAKATIQEVWDRPIPEMRGLVLPIDLKSGERWSDF